MKKLFISHLSVLLISQVKSVIITAFYKEGVLYHIDADEEHQSQRLDDIYLGQVLAAERNGLCFVDIGEREPGLLKKEAGFSFPPMGRKLIVQIAREAFYDKGQGKNNYRKNSHLTQNCLLIHQTVRYQPLKNHLFTLRTSSLLCEEREENIESQKRQLEHLWQHCQRFSDKKGLILPGLKAYERFIRDLTPDHIIVDQPSLLVKVKSFIKLYRPDLLNKCRAALQTEQPLLDYGGLSEILETLRQEVVPLDNGGSLIIDSTACVTTLDINLGRGGEIETNKIAVQAVADQLKWRHISGNVLIDFIDCGKNSPHRQKLVQLLTEALAGSKPEWKILGWSRLGLLELHTAKKRPSLNERLKNLERISN